MSAHVQREKATKKQNRTDTTFVIKWRGPVLEAVAEDEQVDVPLFLVSLSNRIIATLSGHRMKYRLLTAKSWHFRDSDNNESENFPRAFGARKTYR